MRTFFILLVLSGLTANGYSQNKIFLRIYDIKGKKIGKGYLQATSDSSILLTGNKTMLIQYANIGLIKTRRSAGHTMLVTGIASFAAGLTIAHLVNNNPLDLLEFGMTQTHISTGAALLASLITGAANGIVMGGIISGLRKKQSLVINGDHRAWLLVRSQLESAHGRGISYQN